MSFSPKIRTLLLFLPVALLFFPGSATGWADDETPAADVSKVRRIGMIGTTTSHVEGFASVINVPDAPEPMSGYRITAAYVGGMPDNPSSWDRREKYRDYLRDKQGATIHPTIEAMLPHVDCVMLMSVDGRPHLEQARPVIEAGKTLYIDKPFAGSLADAVEIFRLAEEHKVPVFSASSLRYVEAAQKLRNDPETVIFGADVYSPCSLEAHHPRFYWYGIHGAEMLFTLMGPDCEQVSALSTPDADFVTGIWKNGRIGTFRGIRKGASGYGGSVFTGKGIVPAGQYGGYAPLVREICRFFDTGKAPVEPRETLAIFAFMDAAEQSIALGRPVTIEEAFATAATVAEKAIRVELVVPAPGTAKADEVRFDGRMIAADKLASEIAAKKGDSPQTVVKIICRAEKGVSEETVLDVVRRLDGAYLADYREDQ